MIALLILSTVVGSTVGVHAQSPCSISGVDFYPQLAYTGHLVSVTTQVTFICGPSYENVWRVRVDISNSAYNIIATNSTQYVYASYANTRTNVTNTFTAPPKKGALTLDVTAYIIAQSSGKVVASSSSALNIQVQPSTVTYTTTTPTHIQSTTIMQPPTTFTLTTYSITGSGFPLSTDQIFAILAVVLTVLFVTVAVSRFKRTLGKDLDNESTTGPS